MENSVENYMENMPNQSYPVANIPQMQLEAMYPKTYYMVQPLIENTCDAMAMKKGIMHTPNNTEIENMVDEVYTQVEESIYKEVNNSSSEIERQFLGSGRRLLRDFIGTLLIGSLIRRRRPYYGYPIYYGVPYGVPYGSFGGYPYNYF